jgi:hypothetical protein
MYFRPGTYRCERWSESAVEHNKGTWRKIPHADAEANLGDARRRRTMCDGFVAFVWNIVNIVRVRRKGMIGRDSLWFKR